MQSSAKLFSDISFSTILSQFSLDAPRITFYLESQHCPSQNINTIQSLIQKWCLKHNNNIESIIPWCTQTPYAALYKQKYLELCQHNCHLIDNGRQTITMDNQNGTMHIVKPFRIDNEEQNGDLKTVKHISLHITVYNAHYVLDWIEHSVPLQWNTQNNLTIGALCFMGFVYLLMN